MCRCANPSYTVEELVHQLVTASALLVISHPDFIDTALAAARQCGISADHIVLMDKPAFTGPIPYTTVAELVGEGLTLPSSFTERKLVPGEGKTKLAFLSFSSGTTGKPKAGSFLSVMKTGRLILHFFQAVAISHYAVIANVIQMSVYHKVNDAYTTRDKRRFRPGDVAGAGACIES